MICLIAPPSHTGTDAPPPLSKDLDADCSGHPDASSLASTAIGMETPSEPVVAPALGGGRYILGPADLDTSAIASARVEAQTQPVLWDVALTLTTAGANRFNLIASQRYAAYQTDPSNPPYSSLEAVEVNGVVVSAPAIQASHFNGTAVFGGDWSATSTPQQAKQIVRDIRGDLAHR